MVIMILIFGILSSWNGRVSENFRMVVMGEDTVKGIALTMEILRMLRL